MPTFEAPVPLESYAAVIAGLGAGLPLSRALQLAEVRAADWDAASSHWPEAIDESAASDLAVLVAFDAALLTAKRRFDPKVEPIEEDARSFAMFRRHFVTAVDPTAFVTEKGISLSMVARIEADWVHKLAESESLAAAFARHMEAPLDACPALELTPSVLLGSEAERAQSVSMGPDAAPDPGAPRASFSSVAASPIAAAPIGSVPNMAVGQASSMPVSQVSSMPGSPVPSMKGSPVSSLPIGPIPNIPAAPPQNIAITAKPAPMGLIPLNSTGEVPADLVARIARAMPFAKPPDGSPPAAGQVLAATAPVGKAPSVLPAVGAPQEKAPSTSALGIGETGMLPTDLVQRIAKGALPFPKSTEAGASSSNTALADGPTTSRAAELSAPGKELPFRAASLQTPATEAPATSTPATEAPPRPPPPRPPAPRTRSEEPDTIDTSDAPQAPLPFPPQAPNALVAAQRAPAAVGSAAGLKPKAPFTPAIAPSPPAQPPVSPKVDLTLDQYASMCAELHVFPERTEAVFAKYGMTDLKQRAVVDTAWKERLNRYPSERAEWEKRYWQYESGWRRTRR